MKTQEFTPERIREIRLALGMTLAEFGDRCGSHKNIVSRWERDPSKVSAAKPSPGARKIIERMEWEARFQLMKAGRSVDNPDQ